MKDRALTDDRSRLAELFVVDEEKRPVAPVEQLRNPDRAAEAAAVLIEQISRARRVAFVRVEGRPHSVARLRRLYVIRLRVAVGEPVGGVERRVSVILIKAAVEFVPA